MKILPIILSGGQGTRLWPLSRVAFPKQLQSLYGDGSMLQQTAKRLHGCTNVLPPVVVCNESQRFLVAQQLHEVGVTPSKIILEPEGRNTAPAIALPALLTEDPQNTVMVIMSSDHYIDDVDVFRKTVLGAVDAAAQGALMTIGIRPTKPHTGFGYIQKGKELAHTKKAFEVTSFKEKPELAVATEYLEDGGYLWNAGIFAFRADRYLDELQKFEPSIIEACSEALDKSKIDLDFVRLDKDAFAQAPNISVDYAVMERAKQVGVVAADFLWSDVGGWNALHEMGQKDAKNNVTHGDVLLQEVSGSYIRSESRLVTVLGLDDVVVVETSDAVLVTSKAKVDEVKNIVEVLKKQGRSETTEHKRVYRPWGYYESVDAGLGFQVKRIMVKPKAKLSLQKHKQRAEHWVVVDGKARVVCDDEIRMLSSNQSTYIPLGAVHQLENVGESDLYLIEVQSGAYLGEDDIVRLQDVYGRADV